MSRDIDQLLGRLRDLEEEIEAALAAGREEMGQRLRDGGATFTDSVRAEHRRMRIGLLRYLRESSLGCVLTAPAVYALVLPFLLLDAAVALYQAVCFPIWGIVAVRRADHVVVDRHRLAYLNGIEKLNCLYCGYTNGLIALVREVASRTEAYWCPIKHARRVKGAHARYATFADYGDAAGYRRRVAALRADLRRADALGKGGAG